MSNHLPPALPLRAVHHLEIFCNNAKQAAYYYREAFGFSIIGYRGPETGTRDRVSYFLAQDKVRLILTAPLRDIQEIGTFLLIHGDAVRDIALETSDATVCYETALEQGARSVREPRTTEVPGGRITLASIATYGDVIHTFVERGGEAGHLLPGFEPVEEDAHARPVGLTHVDHVVGNVGWFDMDTVVRWYHDVFGMERFVSFDDKDISTEYSALRSTVVANESKWIKFPINEPAQGVRRSQIDEYLIFNNGPGVQHIAIATENIIDTVSKLRSQGVEFLSTPRAYYDVLLDRVGPIDEDIDTLAGLGILVDRDDKGYMLQIFTRPVQDRPTLFIEIIQRKGGESFGKGNFKALFESIEREQERRGNL